MALKIRGFGSGFNRWMRNFLRGFGRPFVRKAQFVPRAGAEWPPLLLAVTADLSFYSSLSRAASELGWTTDWANSMHRGAEICGSRFVQIVVYDRLMPEVDWRKALERLSGAPSRPRVLMAATRVDEDLWRMVLQRHGYDVIARAASTDQWKRELRFAWLSLCEPPVLETAELETAVLSET